MRRMLLVCAGAALLAAVATAQDPIGEISYVEGYPELVRDGDLLPDAIDFGFVVENFDSIGTTDGSFVEVTIDPSTGIDATISIQPDTRFSFDVTGLRHEQTGVIDLVAGTISVVARALAGDSALEVHSASAVMGVRGTTFSVSTAISGEILVSAEQGEVEVSGDGVESTTAEPGFAVEFDPLAGRVRRLQYSPARLAAFRSSWLREREAAFRSNAPDLVAEYGNRYLDAREQFTGAYARLMSYRQILDEWVDENRRGLRLPLGTRVRNRSTLVGTLLRARAGMRQVVRLSALLERMAPYVAPIASQIVVTADVSGLGLFRMVEQDQRILQERVATVMQALKLYALRNDGLAPRDSGGGAGESVDPDQSEMPPGMESDTSEQSRAP